MALFLFSLDTDLAREIYKVFISWAERINTVFKFSLLTLNFETLFLLYIIQTSSRNVKKKEAERYKKINHRYLRHKFTLIFTDYSNHE